MPVNNVSSKEKTIKGMYSLLESDTYTIDKVIKYCKYDNDIIVSFGNILDNYKDYFDQFLEEITLDPKFYYQPAAFAESYYGTPDLDFLVLYFANMTTLFQFNTKKIKVLPPSRLLEINRLFIEYKSIVKDSYSSPTEYIEEPLVKIKK